MMPYDGSAICSALTRRVAVRILAGLAAGAAIAATPACGEPAQQPGEDDDAFLARLIGAASAQIPYRAEPYRVTRTLHIPAGVTVALEAKTRIEWHGPVGAMGVPAAVFETDGDHAGLIASGGEAYIACPKAMPFVYAAMMRGHRGFTVTDVQALNCGHVHVDAATRNYDEVVTEGPGANIGSDIEITGGGARYDTPQTSGEGACYIGSIAKCRLRGARYANVPHGVQWWGGNADPVRPPAQGGIANARKCRDLLIENVSVEHSAGGGIWGSMGRDVTVRDCTVSEIGDVGFDAEGSDQVTFERCTARNAHNGCFTTFFLCNDIHFVDCTGVVDDKAFPLVRVYNASQTNYDNLGLVVTGGTFECRDASGPGTIDTAMGPVGTLLIKGATLKNVRIDTAFFNMHRTRIIGNRLTITTPLGDHAAIRAGASKKLQKAPSVVPGSAIVEDNIIRYTADAEPDETSVGIMLYEDDFNNSADDAIVGNHVSGPFRTGIALVNASSNPGVVPSFAISGNRFSGLAGSRHFLTVKRTTAVARQPAVKWDGSQMLNGQRISLSQALRAGRTSLKSR